jgi:hypothetical protein
MTRFLGLFAMLAACNNGGLEAGHSSTTTDDPPVAQAAQVCLTDGSFDFHVFGDGLTFYEGKQVAVSAIENTTDFSGPDTPTTTHRRPVRMSATIHDGAFSISCPGSLRENYGYPSYALFIDVNGDGKCGAGDVGTDMQLYGWNMAVDDRLGMSSDWAPVSDLPRAIGLGEGSVFCQDYFP